MELNLPLTAPSEPSVFDTAEDAVFNYSNFHVKSKLENIEESGGLSEKMAAWYRFVRDSVRYEPFAIELEAEALSASRTVVAQHGHCLHKSVLFVSGLRAMGVPARLGLARVRNHLATERLERLLRTDVLVPHGYAAFWNGGRWVKVTPVFNSSLCERLGTDPLPWSPNEDSLFQPLDSGGKRFMEYLDDYGLHTTVPLNFLNEALQREYPHCFNEAGQWRLPEA